MKKNKRTKKTALIAVGVAAALAITGALAFFSDSDTNVNRFSMAGQDGSKVVDVDIVEPNWDAEEGKNMLPGETVSKDPVIYNEGDVSVYGFTTVLVPTAKSIKVDGATGAAATQEDIELFTYTVNGPTANTPGWVEIVSARTTNESNEADAPNIYHTAHTYAFVASADQMQEIEAGATTAPSVFADVYKNGVGEIISAADYDALTAEEKAECTVYDGGVTMIAISDGDPVKKDLAACIAGTTLGAGNSFVFKDTNGDVVNVDLSAATPDFTGVDKVYVKAADTYYDTAAEAIADGHADAVEDNGNVVDGNGIRIVKAVGAEELAYAMLDANTVVDGDGNIQYASSSQLAADDNINIYVTGYAIQAENLGTDIPAEVWGICSNAQVSENQTFNYFTPIANDPGLKGADVGA